MKNFPQVDFQITWRPFLLNPDAPKEGVNKKQMYAEKFGEARMKQMLPYITEVFKKVGVEYSLGGMTGSTINSHRLIQWAATVSLEKQDKLVEELFNNYFAQEKFINDKEVLMNAVKVAGLDEAMGAKIIEDESMYMQEVLADLKKYASNVRGVPHYTFNENKRMVLSGGQPPEVFEEMIKDIVDA